MFDEEPDGDPHGECRADGRWVIDFDHGMCTPESARRIAAEFNAAADAAEED